MTLVLGLKASDAPGILVSPVIGVLYLRCFIALLINFCISASGRGGPTPDTG
jgi:hypothetical protein